MGSISAFSCAAILSALLLCIPSSAQSFVGNIEPSDSGVYDVRTPVSGLSLERVSFLAGSKTGRFTLNVYHLNTSEEWIYEYFQVTTSRLQAEPRDFVMDFHISKAWVEENNVALDTVSFFVFDGKDSWTDIPAVKFTEDASFLHYRALSVPSLEGVFAVTAEPVPVQIEFVRHCDGNGVCEAVKGETEENCNDCSPSVAGSKCAPSETYCNGDALFTCSDDGSSYSIETCANGCLDGRCLAYPAPTGMVVVGSPFFMGVVAVLVMVITYMLFSLRNVRRRLSSAERLR
jgi:PGF-pre-PGF domain-containing protein